MVTYTVYLQTSLPPLSRLRLADELSDRVWCFSYKVVTNITVVDTKSGEHNRVVVLVLYQYEIRDCHVLKIFTCWTMRRTLVKYTGCAESTRIPRNRMGWDINNIPPTNLLYCFFGFWERWQSFRPFWIGGWAGDGVDLLFLLANPFLVVYHLKGILHIIRSRIAPGIYIKR